MFKKLFILSAIMAFTLSMASTYASAGMREEIKGSVTKIEDGKVTVLDATGNEKTMKVKDPAALQDLKVGEQISIKDGMLIKESGESSAPKPSAPVHGSKY